MTKFIKQKYFQLFVVELPSFEAFLEDLGATYNCNSDTSQSYEAEFQGITGMEAESFFSECTSPVTSQLIPKTQASLPDVDVFVQNHPDSAFTSHETPTLLTLEQLTSPISSNETNWDNAMSSSENFSSDESLPPSPRTPNVFHQGRHFPTCINIKVEEVTNKVTGSNFEEWKVHNHVRPDGTCKCLEKTKPSKCVIMRSKFLENVPSTLVTL